MPETTTIQDRIRRVQQQIEDERGPANENPSMTAEKLQELAAAAILGGDGEIEKYMEFFCREDPTNPASPVDSQALAKMLPEGGPTNTAKNLARAYLIGNGNCGPASPAGAEQGLLFGVGGILDL